jgi:hypothetical protein
LTFSGFKPHTGPVSAKEQAFFDPLAGLNQLLDRWALLRRRADALLPR